MTFGDKQESRSLGVELRCKGKGVWVAVAKLQVN